MARSQLEADLDAALKELYPQERVIEDMPIKVRGRTLFVDRVIAGPKIAIEADGRQHFEYVKGFHQNADGYAAHKHRDRIKEEWLADNGYTLVRFRYDEKIDAKLLRDKILQALKAE